MLDAPTVLGWDTWHELDERYAFGTIKAVLAVAAETGRIDAGVSRSPHTPARRRGHAGGDGGGAGRRSRRGEAVDDGILRAVGVDALAAARRYSPRSNKAGGVRAAIRPGTRATSIASTKAATPMTATHPAGTVGLGTA